MSHALPRSTLLLFNMLLMWGAVSASLAPANPLCISTPHQKKTVNVRVALSKKTTTMHAIFHHSALDCQKACCLSDARDIRTLLRTLNAIEGQQYDCQQNAMKELTARQCAFLADSICNLVVFKPGKPQGKENCYLFYCKREEDCPLMTMNGVNTYKIFKEMMTDQPSTTMNTTATSTTTSTTTTTTTDSTTALARMTTLKPTTTTTTLPKVLNSVSTTTKINPRTTATPKSLTTTTKIFTNTKAKFTHTAQPAHHHTALLYPSSLAPPRRTDTSTKGAGKGSLVAVVAVGLICLTCLVALVGRKAAESFSHRPYTRLELNNQQFDI